MSDAAPPLTDDDAPPDDPPEPQETPWSARERLNGILRRWYRLQHEIDAYEALHNAEIARLTARREAALGPTLRRVARLKSYAESFAVRAYRDFGETKHRLPNGDITSTAVKISIDKTDDTIANQDWRGLLPVDTIELRPHVDMKKLRGWLENLVQAGHLQRMVSKPSTDPAEVEFWLVDEKEGWPWEFEPGFEGVWFWTEAATEEYDVEHGEILEGVRWAPNGTDGSGRNFKITV